MNIKEQYQKTRMKNAPTFLSKKGYATLKWILVITQLHVETLAIFAFVRWLDLPILWTVEVVIGCVLCFQMISKPLWNEFRNLYCVAEDEPEFVREIEDRVKRSAVVKGAV